MDTGLIHSDTSNYEADSLMFTKLELQHTPFIDEGKDE